MCGLTRASLRLNSRLCRWTGLWFVRAYLSDMSGVMLPYGDAVTTYEVRDNPSENHGNEWPLPPAAVWRIHAARGTRRDATGTGMGRDATGMGRCTFP